MPAEIRNEIYKFVLCDYAATGRRPQSSYTHEPIEMDEKSSTVISKAGKTLILSKKPAADFPAGKGKYILADPQFLLVCTTIFKEACHLRGSALTIDWPYMTTVTKISNRLDHYEHVPARFKTIRQLRVVMIDNKFRWANLWGKMPAAFPVLDSLIIDTDLDGLGNASRYYKLLHVMDPVHAPKVMVRVMIDRYKDHTRALAATAQIMEDIAKSTYWVESLSAVELDYH